MPLYRGSRRLILQRRVPVAAAVATTTWDSANKSADITLSNGNLTATVGGAGGGNPGVTAVASHSTGQFYYEVHIDAFTTNWWTGVANGSEAVGSPPGVFDSNGVGYRASDGLVVNNAFTTAGTAAAGAVGNTISVAADLGAKLIWFRVNAGNWNNNGSADPATGVGGFAFGGFAGPYFPKFNGGGNVADAATANFGGSAYAQAVPSGYGNW